MKQRVYIDVLIILNIFVNYFLLLETSFLSNEKIKRLRILLASVLGGIYSLIILLPQMNVPISILLKVAFSVSIIFAAFKIKNIKHFLRLFAIFFAVNFIYAGIMLAVWIAFKPNGMQFNNGAVYFDINALMLTGLTILCYLIVTLISKFAKKKAPIDKIVDVTIRFEEKTVTGKGLIDTGNSLCDTFSGAPVMVAEYDLIKKLLPHNLDTYIKATNDNYDDNLVENYKNKLRLIPFSSIGGNGLLKAFRADEIEIKTDNKVVKTKSIYVAVKDANLSNGEYSAILNPELVNFKNNEEAIQCLQN